MGNGCLTQHTSEQQLTPALSCKHMISQNWATTCSKVKILFEKTELCRPEVLLITKTLNLYCYYICEMFFSFFEVQFFTGLFVHELMKHSQANNLLINVQNMAYFA